MKRAYALIYAMYCSEDMQNRVDDEIEIDQSIRHDTIKLLQTVRTVMRETGRAQYPYEPVVNVIADILQIRQMSNESLSDYSKRFRQHRDTLKQMVGTHMLDSWTETLAAYKKLENKGDAAGQKAMKDGSFAAFTSFIFIKGTDPDRYGSLLTGLVTQYSLGNDQWPKTNETCMAVLAAHRSDNGAWNEWCDGCAEVWEKTVDGWPVQQEAEDDPMASPYGATDIVMDSPDDFEDEDPDDSPDDLDIEDSDDGLDMTDLDINDTVSTEDEVADMPPTVREDTTDPDDTTAPVRRSSRVRYIPGRWTY
jgi:hypothetical protein